MTKKLKLVLFNIREYILLKKHGRFIWTVTMIIIIVKNVLLCKRYYNREELRSLQAFLESIWKKIISRVGQYCLKNVEKTHIYILVCMYIIYNFRSIKIYTLYYVELYVNLCTYIMYNLFIRPILFCQKNYFHVHPKLKYNQ